MDSDSRAAATLEPPVLAPGRRFGSRYTLERPIGRGGMAAVWLATDERLGRKVALKVLSDTVVGDEEFLGRFRREARIAAGLTHPNLVRIYDFDAGARPYLVMEYVEGGTLAELIAARGDLDPEALAAELLEALRHIHAAGILHRDVKPHNVLIDSEGHPRLTDFGIALSRDATALTRAGHVIGTETYLAPELRRGDPATERSDLYALGIVLADAAGGVGCGAGLWALIERLRAPDPAERPHSAAAALRELERTVEPSAPPTQAIPVSPDLSGDRPPVDEEPTAERPVDLPPPARPWRSRLALVGAIGAAALAAGVALAIGIGGGDDPAGSGAANANSDRAEKPSKSDKPQPTPVAEEPVAEEPAPPAAAETEGDGAALNQEGFDLINAGQPEDAIPVLEDAVAALEGSGDDLTYNYALFNLAHALRLAGRPDEAIPLLEQRLEYPDQQEEVAAELAEAQEAAGASGGVTAEGDQG